MRKNPRLRLGLLALLAVGLPISCALIGPEGFGLPDQHTAIGRALLTLRLHRLATGFVVGAALASAGVVFQAVLRNPLADPYVLGISSGGALGAALTILLGWYAIHPAMLPLMAFVCAGATLGLVYALASRDGVPSVYGLILSGVIVSAMASSLLLLLLSLASVEGLHSVTWWALGNLQGSSADLLIACAACAGVGLLINLALARELNVLSLGTAPAHNLGVRPGRIVTLALAAATLAAAAAVALAGLIGFVGLIVPHAVRHVLGADHRRLLVGSALTGGALLVACDTLARTLMAPRELPVGVITALVGGPFFLFLLRSRRQILERRMNDSAPVLQFDAVDAGYRGHPVLQGFSLTLAAGDCLALIGPNGVGKTTVLQVATGLLPCRAGRVCLFGEPVAKLPAAYRARRVGVVAPELTTPMAFTVEEMVAMGRTAHLSRWSAPSAHDREAVEAALAMSDTRALRHRVFQSLSSGERQRVAMAMALAGEPSLLLLDEATSHLDMSHRLEVVNLIRRINAERHITVVMVVHDLNLAAEFFPRIALMSAGRIVADGTPSGVMQEALLASVYGCAVTVRRDEAADCLRIFPRSA